MNIQITAMTANRSHLLNLIALGKTYYPIDHPVLTEDFLNWFYLDNPAGPATLIVAHEDDLWISLIVLIPVMLECAGQSQKACYAVNVLTHPEHRGKNLFVKMICHAKIHLSNAGVWLLGHPNANAVPGWKRQKMEFKNPLHLYLAKIRLPFSPVREKHIVSLKQLRAIPSSFWNGLVDRPDAHVKCSPEYISWRFLDAPHKKYVVSSVEKHGELIGLRVTRHYKGPIDLMVDFIAPIKSLSDLLSSVRRPTLVMHPGIGTAEAEVRKACWKLPVKRQFPFFVTTWEQKCVFDVSGITLAASDF